MADSGSSGLRREVAARAGRRCEYCRMPEWALLAGCEVDHVISRKHGGITDLSNGARIVALTEVGQVTIQLLRLNDEERIVERAVLQLIGQYPQT